MKDRSMSLSAQQRSALILCDGKRSAFDVVKMTAAVGVTMLDIDQLMSLGLIDNAAPVASAPAKIPVDVRPSASEPSVQSTSAEAADPSADYGTALNAAITLCSGLGFKGFSLNMALTGVDSLEKLQKLAPEIRRAAGDAKYKALHEQIFGKPM